MVKKIFFSLILLLGVGIGVGLSLAKSEKAKKTVVAEPVMAIENTLSSTEVPTLDEDASEDIAMQSPEEVLQSLNEKAAANLEPGWIHVHTEKFSDMDSGNHGVFPNGVVIPLHQVNDFWAFLNEDQLVIESVSIMRSIEGEVIQVGTYKNGIGNNSVIDDPNAHEPSPIVLDWNFSHDLERMRENGEMVTFREFADEDGAMKVEFRSLSIFEVPIKSIDYDQPLVSMETRVLFDKESGVLELKEVIAHLEDGTERVSQRLMQEITQEVPTSEALVFLNERDE